MPPRTCQILLASNASCYAKKGFFFLWGNYALEVKDVEPENRRSRQSCSRRKPSEYRGALNKGPINAEYGGVTVITTTLLWK